VLAKLERAMPNVSVVFAGGRRDVARKSPDDAYGTIEYVYGNRSDVSRSTSPREILPLLYALASTQPPASAAGAEYPGYPLVASAEATWLWFLGGLPVLIVLGWSWTRRPPRIPASFVEGGPP
jgi:ABC-2 type transport system permease protein